MRLRLHRVEFQTTCKLLATLLFVASLRWENEIGESRGIKYAIIEHIEDVNIHSTFIDIRDAPRRERTNAFRTDRRDFLASGFKRRLLRFCIEYTIPPLFKRSPHQSPRSPEMDPADASPATATAVFPYPNDALYDRKQVAERMLTCFSKYEFKGTREDPLDLPVKPAAKIQIAGQILSTISTTSELERMHSLYCDALVKQRLISRAFAALGANADANARVKREKAEKRAARKSARSSRRSIRSTRALKPLGDQKNLPKKKPSGVDKKLKGTRPASLTRKKSSNSKRAFAVERPTPAVDLRHGRKKRGSVWQASSAVVGVADDAVRGVGGSASEARRRRVQARAQQSNGHHRLNVRRTPSVAAHQHHVDGGKKPIERRARRTTLNLVQKTAAAAALSPIPLRLDVGRSSSVVRTCAMTPPSFEDPRWMPDPSLFGEKHKKLLKRHGSSNHSVSNEDRWTPDPTKHTRLLKRHGSSNHSVASHVSNASEGRDLLAPLPEMSMKPSNASSSLRDESSNLAGGSALVVRKRKRSLTSISIGLLKNIPKRMGFSSTSKPPSPGITATKTPQRKSSRPEQRARRSSSTVSLKRLSLRGLFSSSSSTRANDEDSIL